MDFNQMFPQKESNSLKASDLQGREFSLTIKSISKDDKLGKPIIMFEGAQKGLVCNVTNAKRIAHYYGKDTTGWIGKKLVLYMELVDFEGKMVEAIRVKAPAGVGAFQAPDSMNQVPSNEVPFDDAIPF